ncbi:DDE-type integrase/transposase/recombinase [Pseudoteredinibacter isoporae]|uniref:DDE-type integrase/transposase/recombinase n=1 Tax=Pseudoteredinibacter isoporae TaxID=570281 RepID=UPI003527D548
MTKRRNKYAATRFFKKLFKTQTQTTRKITTDRLASYRSALRDLGCTVQHSTAQYHNNIAEISHQKNRQQERQMRCFKSVGQAQWFLTCHGVINNHFRQQRHPLKAKYYRELRNRAFSQWQQVTCASNMEAA